MKKILWLSRNKPLIVQINELQKIFGEIEIDQNIDPFKNADEIFSTYCIGNYDEMVIIAPLSVISEILKKGIKPLFAEMKEVDRGDDYDLNYKGRRYKFIRFERITSIIINKEPLTN